MSSKKQVLLKFIESNKHLPEQGSEQWLLSRGETIGGSEISTILGVNPYQTIKKLINQKLGLTKFTKSAPLWFGNIMEYPLQQYTENKFNTKIYETGSIQFTKSEFIKYSPDGISVINKKNLLNIFTEDDINTLINKRSNFDNTHSDFKDELLILFEFKNPYMRVIKPNEIPIYYKPQPQLGLEVIDICEVSIFIESVFRFCSYNDIILQNNKYNTRYHYDKIRYNNEAISYSAFTLFYKKNSINTLNKRFNNLLNELNHFLQSNDIHENDISNITDYKIINAIMENIIDHKDIKIVYHTMYMNKSEDYDDDSLYYFNKCNNINKFKAEVKDKKKSIQDNDDLEYIGCFCYKMFNINIKPVFKSDIITDKLLNKVENVIKTIRRCNSTDCKITKKSIIDIAHSNNYVN